MTVQSLLSLAAAPVFATMAILTAMDGGSRAAPFCGAMPDASDLNGMMAMYSLMSAFHSGPWLRRIGRWRRSRPSFAADRA
jgi:hypothetical protein